MRDFTLDFGDDGDFELSLNKGHVSVLVILEDKTKIVINFITFERIVQDISSEISSMGHSIISDKVIVIGGDISREIILSHIENILPDW